MSTGNKKYRLLKDIFDANTGTIFTQLGCEYEQHYEYETIQKGKFKRTHKHFVEGNDLWFQEIKEDKKEVEDLVYDSQGHDGYYYRLKLRTPLIGKDAFRVVREAIEKILNSDTPPSTPNSKDLDKKEVPIFSVIDSEAMKDKCSTCGDNTVLIRGKYPNTPKRAICPTCTTEKLEHLQEISSPDYGKTYQNNQ